MVGREMDNRYPAHETNVGGAEILRVENWTAYHPDDSSRVVVDGVNLNVRKGEIVGIAGIMGAKKTSELIPLCHPIALTRVAVEFEVLADSSEVVCTATAETVGQTGVEMEALTAVQVALLTIYDMCKAVDRGMTMTDVHLLEKHGGKSGSYVAA